MKTLGKYLATAGVTAAIGAAAIVASSAPASAEVVCNRHGDCWHVRDHYDYRPEFGVVVHPDGWRWGRHSRFHWREHEGRGYWRDGVWIQF
ncbi:MAG TPA: hypothetical protein VN723_15870 [Rhizomicrobium sp.]|jgi:hypothetical protein|nr:hypothetical protein [Rhizomicrobium sp.]